MSKILTIIANIATILSLVVAWVIYAKSVESGRQNNSIELVRQYILISSKLASTVKKSGFVSGKKQVIDDDLQENLLNTSYIIVLMRKSAEFGNMNEEEYYKLACDFFKFLVQHELMGWWSNFVLSDPIAKGPFSRVSISKNCNE